ncbi:MAG: hypothetical protein Q4G70_05740 [Pseudomonadota bacterium]|nr:hypothetical protein [Pseudomonadota bacterium]
MNQFSFSLLAALAAVVALSGCVSPAVVDERHSRVSADEDASLVSIAPDALDARYTLMESSQCIKHENVYQRFYVNRTIGNANNGKVTRVKPGYTPIQMHLSGSTHYCIVNAGFMAEPHKRYVVLGSREGNKCVLTILEQGQTNQPMRLSSPFDRPHPACTPQDIAAEEGKAQR